jgi:integrase
MSRPQSAPTYLRHGRYARTKLNGQYVGLGLWNSDESLKRFEEVRVQWRANSSAPHCTAQWYTTVSALADAWVAHVEKNALYRRLDGTPTRETDSWRLSAAPMLRLFGSEAASDFSPRKLKAVREAMLTGSWLTPEERVARTAGARELVCSRKTANQRVGRIIRLFEFGVSEELVPVAVHQALQTVTPLPATNVTRVAETPIAEVPDADIRRTLPLLAPIPRALALLQLATGMRPGEVCSIERANIDTTGIVVGQRRLWVYRPGGGDRHKTAHHGIKRQIPLGPAAQYVLRPFMENAMNRNPGADCVWLFESRTRDGRIVHYHTNSYSQQVLAAAREAGVPDWQPNRLRKTAATDIEARMDLEHARATLGHARPETTKKFYAKADLLKAAEGAAKMG